MEFKPFPKLHRLYRDIVVTEKLDGTNAQITIEDLSLVPDTSNAVAVVGTQVIFAGSRNRWITPEQDNFGFAAWVKENAEQLVELGVGSHFGEWWGRGIQRGYGLDARRFSLFNTGRWFDAMGHRWLCPKVCEVVPVLYMGPFDKAYIDTCLLDLYEKGSTAAPGYTNPEGVVVYHTHSGQAFKVTLDNNDEHKWAAK